MKRFLLLFLSLISLALISCSSVFEANVKHGSLCVTMPGGNERSVVYSEDVYYFEICLEPAVVEAKIARPGETVEFSELEPGAYTIFVKGFRQDNVEIFSGAKQCEIKNENTQVNVIIGPSDAAAPVLLNEKEYASIKEAFNDVVSGVENVIELTGNAIINGYMAVPEKCYVKINLAGHNLFVKSWDGSDKNEQGGDVVRTCYFDVNKEGAALIVNNGYVFGCGTTDRILFRSGTTLELNDLIINGIRSRAALVYSGGGMVIVNNIKIINCKVINDGLLNAESDALKDMRNNSLLHFSNSNLTMKDCSIENCLSEYGSVIKFVAGQSVCSISDSKIYQAQESLNPAFYGNAIDSSVVPSYLFSSSKFYGKKTAVKLEGSGRMIISSPADSVAEDENYYTDFMSDSENPMDCAESVTIATGLSNFRLNGIIQ